MKNWTLGALGMMAAGAMMISSAACSTSSSSSAGAGAGGSSSGSTFDCASLCARSDAAMCSGDTAGSCMTSCTDIQSKAAAKNCTPQLNAVGACYSSATFTCDMKMPPMSNTTACSAEVKDLSTCLSATGAGGMAGAGGSGMTTDTTILGAFEDPTAPMCHDCLKGMTGSLKLVDGSMLDCSAVAAACGAKDEKCSTEVSCIDAYVTAHSKDKLDCAVDKCISTGVEANNFFNCAADRCGTQCTLTVGFTTTTCGM